MPWTLIVRCGPRVKRSTHDQLEAALTALEARGRELADAAPRETMIRARRFDPRPRSTPASSSPVPSG